MKTWQSAEPLATNSFPRPPKHDRMTYLRSRSGGGRWKFAIALKLLFSGSSSRGLRPASPAPAERSRRRRTFSRDHRSMELDLVSSKTSSPERHSDVASASNTSTSAPSGSCWTFRMPEDSLSMYFPSADTARSFTGRSLMMETTSPSVFHMMVRASWLAVTRRFPSGSQAPATVQATCLCRVLRRRPVAVSQRMHRPPSQQTRSIVSSGDHETWVTSCSWP
mmetsp:Transcript_25096/g.59807  ORF Transcript_25096/g.59807 Transcript_25096/m.59807 type:complete len:222 (+) Transcript_25096:382-1047(+)